MLVLSRKLSQQILIGSDITITVVKFDGHQVRLGIEAPADISILFIEHDMDLVFRFASRITVLAMGAILMEGTPKEVETDPKVREIYLGESRG